MAELGMLNGECSPSTPQTFGMLRSTREGLPFPRCWLPIDLQMTDEAQSLRTEASEVAGVLAADAPVNYDGDDKQDTGTTESATRVNNL